MNNADNAEMMFRPNRIGQRWNLIILMALVFIVPFLGTLILNSLFPSWIGISLPIHSTLEMAGAAFGLFWAIFILLSQQKTPTSRRVWVSCALISMAILDIGHSCVPDGNRFMWLRSLSVLAGGVFFSLTWYPDRKVSRQTTWVTSALVLLVAFLISLFSILNRENVPRMIADGNLTPLVNVINLIGGGLTLLASLNFAIRYYKERTLEELLFLVLCILFGVSGILFHFSTTWQATWWFSHVVRFGAYFCAFWLVMISYRTSENEMIHAHDELRDLFHFSVDGKRMINKEFRHLRANESFATFVGLSKESLEPLKCYEALGGALCESDQCPMRVFESTKKDKVDYEIIMKRTDGSEMACLMKAIRMNRPDGSFRGIIESFIDITDRKKGETELKEKADKLKTLSNELEIIIDAIPGLVFYKDIDNRYVRVNKYVAEAHKMRKSELEGQSCWDLYPHELAKKYFDDDMEVVKSGKAKLNLDEPWETEEGAKWVNTNKIPYADQTGKIVGLIGVSMDITERKKAEDEISRQARLKSAQTELSDLLLGDKKINELCQNTITYLCKYMNAQTGLMYLDDGNGALKLETFYAHKRPSHLPNEYKYGEGLIGQAALEMQELFISDVPDNYIRIECGLGEAVPRNIYIKPIIRDNRVKAVLEFGSLFAFDESHFQFLDEVSTGVAMTLESAEAKSIQAELLNEAQLLTEELQVQQEELKTSNEELVEQSQRLKESEDKLKTQQEELQVTNEELEEKNELLERQKREVDDARKEIEKKASELALASRYKSEFLANMSHELRTPLNSLLLLAQSLTQNKEGNLTDDQVEALKIIYGGGNDLLNLINEILDLARIEAGRMDLKISPMRIEDLARGVRSSFRHLAKDKNLDFDVVVAGDAPDEIKSDGRRIEQIIKNLVSNAIKFTDEGGITVTFNRPAAESKLFRNGLDPEQTLVITVKDTGIGISQENQKIIFEAFQQVDGSAARKHSGTGLGLSISREIAQLLGGMIQVESEIGTGSTFSLFLPLEAFQKEEEEKITKKPAMRAARSESAIIPSASNAVFFVDDDRNAISEGDNVMLLIEDDERFAKILVGNCRERGLKCIATPTGESGLELAARYPLLGIILDIKLPGLDGWSVLTALKENIHTRHIPVHVVSVEKASMEAVRKGAIGHVTKPLSLEDLEDVFKKIKEASPKSVKRLLIIEDDPQIRKSVVQLIGDGDVVTDEAETGRRALESLQSIPYDCVVLDLGLPDMTGLELLKTAKTEGVNIPPVIIYTAWDLSQEQENELKQYAETIVLKDVRSKERLLDEVSLFLHRVVGRLPEKTKQIIKNLHETDELLKDKKVLVVDDDMRTLYAVTRLLKERGMNAIKAADGEDALKTLDETPDIDIVLMDIMMPMMDGYETMKRIRVQERFRNLPIIALTAKAMKEDREKCINAGANDYMSKPVDQERLISLLRVWLYR